MNKSDSTDDLYRRLCEGPLDADESLPDEVSNKDFVEDSVQADHDYVRVAKITNPSARENARAPNAVICSCMVTNDNDGSTLDVVVPSDSERLARKFVAYFKTDRTRTG